MLLAEGPEGHLGTSEPDVTFPVEEQDASLPWTEDPGP